MNPNETVLMPSLNTMEELANEMGLSPTKVGQIYRQADQLVKTWTPGPAAGNVTLTPELFALANRVHTLMPNLKLTPSELFTVAGILEPWGEFKSDKDFVEAANLSLDKAGLLDTPGDCPICKKSGYPAAARHHVCVRVLLTKTLCKCAYCGQQANDTREWVPICNSCYAHQAHLDALAD